MYISLYFNSQARPLHATLIFITQYHSPVEFSNWTGQKLITFLQQYESDSSLAARSHVYINVLEEVII